MDGPIQQRVGLAERRIGTDTRPQAERCIHRNWNGGHHAAACGDVVRKYSARAVMGIVEALLQGRDHADAGIDAIESLAPMFGGLGSNYRATAARVAAGSFESSRRYSCSSMTSQNFPQNLSSSGAAAR